MFEVCEAQRVPGTASKTSNQGGPSVEYTPLMVIGEVPALVRTSVSDVLGCLGQVTPKRLDSSCMPSSIFGTIIPMWKRFSKLTMCGRYALTINVARLVLLYVIL